MSAAPKHAHAAESSDRPAKRVRVSEEAEDDDAAGSELTPSKSRAEPQKASDLYLDTVGLVGHIARASPLSILEDQQSCLGF